MIRLTFLGAAGTVTGSKILVEHNGSRVLIDCGLFQGFKQLRELNWKPTPIDPSTLDAVVLTHAHIDHTGYLPLLVSQGYKGPIYATSATAARANAGVGAPSASRTGLRRRSGGGRMHQS